MNTPYNTGKVLIGVHYLPPIKHWTPSRDELTIQAAVLENSKTPASILKRAVNAIWRRL